MMLLLVGIWVSIATSSCCIGCFPSFIVLIFPSLPPRAYLIAVTCFFSPLPLSFFFFQTQCFASTETKAGRSPEMRSVRGEGEIRGIMLIPWGWGSAMVCMFDENQKWGLGGSLLGTGG